MSDLKSQHCVPCEGGIPKLEPAEVQARLAEIPGWTAREERLGRTFQFKDFREAMGFLNRMADVAEGEGHHPDFCVHYNRVDVTVWTHAIGGLSENDFILAAKIDALV
jgi:4a-hydroxytetrahydrobiopterin dehydratase